MSKKILLLGSGELGKELVIALQRLGQYVIAVDQYEGAPAMQVAQEFEVVNMLDGEALDKIVAKHKPDLIVPESEAINTERFFDYEKQGITVLPSAKAAHVTLNRKAIRELAFKELNLKTAKYVYASTKEEFNKAIWEVGIPCVVKPLVSSYGKGQSIIKTEKEIDKAWDHAVENSHGDIKEVIVEKMIRFNNEITLLTVTQKTGAGLTLFCPPIGHRQENGAYQESWQPCIMKESDLKEAQIMAAQITRALGGPGVWSVEFFLTDNGVYFSELSPRPNDTGMVTLAGTQNLNEFELHARAILGLPIPQITLDKIGASAVVLASQDGKVRSYKGIEDLLLKPNTDVRIFNKPATRPYLRMGVVLTYDKIGTDINTVTKKVIEFSRLISIQYQ